MLACLLTTTLPADRFVEMSLIVLPELHCKMTFEVVENRQILLQSSTC